MLDISSGAMIKFQNLLYITKEVVTMKNVIIALIAVVAFAGSAFAGAQENYEYKGGAMGKVAFSHKAHMKLGCKKCHEGAPAKIEMNKAVGHDKLCVKCHKAEKKGPQGCKDCHKK
jgi:hypothetical protein